MTIDSFGACPKCATEWLHVVDGKRYTRLIGCVSRETDRVEQWQCPDCQHRWARGSLSPTKNVALRLTDATDPEPSSDPLTDAILAALDPLSEGAHAYRLHGSVIAVRAAVVKAYGGTPGETSAAARLASGMGEKSCGCHACNDKRWSIIGRPEHALVAATMILCETCGNKRCPHASDHRLACTKSNEPGQVGSVY